MHFSRFPWRPRAAVHGWVRQRPPFRAAAPARHDDQPVADPVSMSRVRSPECGPLAAGSAAGDDWQGELASARPAND